MGFERLLRATAEVALTAGAPLARASLSTISLIFAAQDNLLPFVSLQVVCFVTDLEGRTAKKLRIPLHHHALRDKLADTSWFVGRNVGTCLFLGRLLHDPSFSVFLGIGVLTATLIQEFYIATHWYLSRHGVNVE